MKLFWEGDGVYYCEWSFGQHDQILLVDKGQVTGPFAALFAAQNSWMSGFTAVRIGAL